MKRPLALFLAVVMSFSCMTTVMPAQAFAANDAGAAVDTQNPPVAPGGDPDAAPKEDADALAPDVLDGATAPLAVNTDYFTFDPKTQTIIAYDPNAPKDVKFQQRSMALPFCILEKMPSEVNS